MLKKIRIIVAWIVFVAALLLVLDLTGALHTYLGWIAKVQLIPAILATSAAALVFVGLLTLIFGRLYCSILCPTGIMQDGISWLSARRKGKKARFSYSKPLTWLRWTVLVVVLAAGILGINAVVSLFDPWAIFGRTASLLEPVVEGVASYAVYPREVYIKSGIVFATAIVTLIVIAILSWRKGRTWCNTICPVGTLLGAVSLAAPFRIRFNEAKCTKCGLCEKNCKSSCIDSKAQKIDQTRCVVCLDCLDKCKFDALHYSACAPVSASEPEKKSGSAAEPAPSKGINRRNFLAVAAVFAVTNTVKAQQLTVDGGLADIEDKKRPDRKTPVTPPGSGDAKHLQTHCTACQLCVTACPNNVLRPSSRLQTLMQPEMTYERGYCRPECVECSEVCPTGAIKRITPADKTAISIGNANWIEANCVVNRDNVPCTECERHCPTKAITLIPRDPADPKSLKIPTIDNTKCIGCGACEHLCPARPFSAIYVEGNVTHHTV